ncbi:MAG: hypothetical protein ACOYWZ_06580 [Bacillota bacterium]
MKLRFLISSIIKEGVRMENKNEKENVLLIINNIIYILLLSCLCSFIIFVALFATPEQNYKHYGVGSVAIPLLLLNNICGWIIWKINGKPIDSYSKWKYTGNSGFGVRVVEIIFVCSVIFAFIMSFK